MREPTRVIKRPHLLPCDRCGKDAPVLYRRGKEKLSQCLRCAGKKEL